jgi:hypothetical protein
VLSQSYICKAKDCNECICGRFEVLIRRAKGNEKVR